MMRRKRRVGGPPRRASWPSMLVPCKWSPGRSRRWRRTRGEPLVWWRRAAPCILPAVRSSEGEYDPEEESQKKVTGRAKESFRITTAPSGKVDDGDEDEEAVVEVIKKEHNEEAKETKGSSTGEGREEAVRNLRKGNGSEGYLDLLLEAMQQVSSGLFDEEPAKEEETVDTEEERPSK